MILLGTAVAYLLNISYYSLMQQFIFQMSHLFNKQSFQDNRPFDIENVEISYHTLEECFFQDEIQSQKAKLVLLSRLEADVEIILLTSKLSNVSFLDAQVLCV